MRVNGDQGADFHIVIRRRVLVRGVVQGVFFRDSCRREARAHGVSGWVTNTVDGAVEAVFEGEPDAVRQLVDWARQGPSRAAVRSIEVFDEPVQGERGFEVV